MRRWWWWWRRRGRRRLTVGGDVDFVRQFGHVDLEAVLHVVQGLGVGLVGDKSDGQTFGSKSTCAGNLAGGGARWSDDDESGICTSFREGCPIISTDIGLFQ